MYKRIKSIGKVELWKHPEGHRFLRFKDSSMQPHEIPHPDMIPNKDLGFSNFVTHLKTTVNGKKQKIWAKEVAYSVDEDRLKTRYANMRNNSKSNEAFPYTKRVHQARALKELRAAGFNAAEPLGILYSNDGTAFLLTSNIKGRHSKGASSKLEERLAHAGFDTQDLHGGNVLKTRKGETIVDASLFGPTNKSELKKAIRRASFIQKKKAQSPFQRLVKFFTGN